MVSKKSRDAHNIKKVSTDGDENNAENECDDTEANNRNADGAHLQKICAGAVQLQSRALKRARMLGGIFEERDESQLWCWR